MRKKLSKILISGGAGFIGSAFVRLLARDYSRKGLSLIVVDKLTYAGDLARLSDAKGKFRFYKADICDQAKIESIFSLEKIDIVINFAAESHVDRSIKNASLFVDTNIKGVLNLLDASRRHKVKKFIQISSDEVYGGLKKGELSEDSPLRPSSPYAASKAAADLLIKSYIRTHAFPAIIIRPSNNYGPWQYPEKLIPLAILKIIKKQKVPVYAAGKNIREWLYVDDCVKGIYRIMQKGKAGEIYNLGSGEEKKNLEVVKTLLRVLQAADNLIKFVKDRAGHDIRYRLDAKKTLKQTGWKPQVRFTQGIRLTADWYLRHSGWLLSK
jgi:dTDP-glucose 4,6-dehydratase